MAITITIQKKDKKVRSILKNLEDFKLIQIIHESSIRRAPKKQRQAKDFLKASESAQLHEKSKKKLKIAQSLLNEL
jgi:predicted transcriptional regulator